MGKSLVVKSCPQLNALIDFVNIRPWNEESILSFREKWCSAEKLLDKIFHEATSKDESLEILLNLRSYWRGILDNCRLSQLQDIRILNEIASRIKCVVVETVNPFVPTIDFDWKKDDAGLNDWLEYNYLHAATLHGDAFTRLRACDNIFCWKVFLYNRPKQIFCCPACKDQHHNNRKIESGYLARHQAKGRAENPDVYLLK